jgi:hypothetical protein
MGIHPAQDDGRAGRVRTFLRALFLVHGVVTLAAAMVLVVVPAAIPATVGIAIDAEGFLLSYFLAAAELAIALLSFGAAWLTDVPALRLIVVVFIVFHLATAGLEIAYLGFTAASPVLLANIAIRIAAAALFFFAWRTRQRPVRRSAPGVTG